jgi:Cadherin-like beta sandwich domain
MRNTLGKFPRWLPVLALLLLWACRVTDTEGDEYLVFHLSESLADYARVDISLVSPDTSVTYELIWNAKLPNPSAFPRHKLGAAKGKDFVIRVRAYNDKSEQVLAKNIPVVAAAPGAELVFQEDLRLRSLITSAGDFAAGYSPDTRTYSLQVPDSLSSVTFTAQPMDTSATLTINGTAETWGKPVRFNLQSGDNLFDLSISGRQSASLKYQVDIVRGRPTLPDSDVVPPPPAVKAPTVSGTSPTNAQPAWTWTSGGGGNGTFRYKLNDDKLETGATETTATAWAYAGAPVTGTTYILYVQERNATGDWSASGSRAILYDAAKPTVAITAPLASGIYVTKNATVTVSGTVSGPNAISKLSYKSGSAAAVDVAFASGAWSIPGIALTNGVAIPITVTATDALGNSGDAALTLLRDATAPSAPVLTSVPVSPTAAAKATWAWTAGGDGATGSGLSGRYRYSLDAGKSWKDTLTATTVAEVPISEGDNIFTLQEEDLAGNWSVSAQDTVKSDRTGPVLVIVTPINPSTLATTKTSLTGTAMDAGSTVQSIVVTGQTAGAGAATITGSNWNSAPLTLKSGVNDLVVTATDAVGNPSTALLKLTVTVPVPSVSISSPLNNAWVTKDSVMVTYKVDGGTAQTKTFTGLVEGDNLLTITSPPNETGVTGSASVTVRKDGVLPNAPALAAGAAYSKTTPVFTAASKGDNAGGSGVSTPPVFRYQVNGTGGYTIVNTSTINLTTVAEGRYSLTIQEQDKAGNWSLNSNAVTVVYDKTPPAVVITSPASGYITSLDHVTIDYTETGSITPGAKSKTVTLANDNGVANTITIGSAADSANNLGSATITVYRRSNVIFVKPAPSGAKNGTSWADATLLDSAVSTASTSATSMEIWMTAGRYDVDDGQGLGSHTHIYGAFPTAGTAKALTDRIFASGPGTGDSTIIFDGSGSNGVFAAFGERLAGEIRIKDVLLDNIKIEFSGSQSAFNMHIVDDITFNKVYFLAKSGGNIVLQGDGDSLTLKNCKISGVSLTAPVDQVMNIQGSSLTFNGCEISGGSRSVGGPVYPYEFNVWRVNIINSKFLDQIPSGNYLINWTITADADLNPLFQVTGSTFRASDWSHVIDDPYNPDGLPAVGDNSLVAP